MPDPDAILWLVHDPEGGFSEHASEADAREEMEAVLDATEDRAADGWEEGSPCPALYRCERVAHVEPRTTPVEELPEEEAGWTRAHGWDFRVEFEIVEDDAPPPDPVLLAAVRELAEEVERLRTHITARERVMQRECAALRAAMTPSTPTSTETT